LLIKPLRKLDAAPARRASRSATSTMLSPVTSAHASCIWRRLVLGAACTPAAARRARVIIFIITRVALEESLPTRTRVPVG